MSLYFKNKVIQFILHTDLDGKCPKFLANYINKWLPEDNKIKINVVYAQNSEMDEVIYNTVLREFKCRIADSIYIIDISPTTQKTITLINDYNTVYGTRVEVFDHHKTSEFLKEYSWMHHDNTICGTRIFWEYIQENVALEIPTPEFLKLDRFVTYVDDWDTWKWKNTDKYKGIKYPIPAVLSNALNTLGYDIFEFVTSDLLMSACTLDYTFYDFEQLYKQKIEDNAKFVQNITSELGAHSLVCVGGHEIPFFKKSDEVYRVGIIYSDNSDVSSYSQLILDCPNLYIDALVVLSLNHISFRRHKDSKIELIDVCKQLGGGGHPDACGCDRNKDSEEIYKFYLLKVLDSYNTK